MPVPGERSYVPVGYKVKARIVEEDGRCYVVATLFPPKDSPCPKKQGRFEVSEAWENVRIWVDHAGQVRGEYTTFGEAASEEIVVETFPV